MYLLILIALSTLVIDQLTKFLIERNLYGKSMDIIKSIFSFTYLENRGAAWGIFSDSSRLLLIFIPFLIVGIIFCFYKLSFSNIERACGGLIVGGAIGNYTDRVFRGYVIDFLDFKIWPIFNFADIFIVVGCILFIIFTFKGKKV